MVACNDSVTKFLPKYRQLTFPVLDELHGVEGRDYILHVDVGEAAQFADGNVLVDLLLFENGQQHPPPVAAVAHFAQVREWLLRRSNMVFAFRQAVA